MNRAFHVGERVRLRVAAQRYRAGDTGRVALVEGPPEGGRRALVPLRDGRRGLPLRRILPRRDRAAGLTCGGDRRRGPGWDGAHPVPLGVATRRKTPRRGAATWCPAPRRPTPPTAGPPGVIGRPGSHPRVSPRPGHPGTAVAPPAPGLTCTTDDVAAGDTGVRMPRAHRHAAGWAAAFEGAARELLGGSAGGEGYPVSALACARHGPRRVCVTYGVLREHLRWRGVGARSQARRAVVTMLPPVPCPPALSPPAAQAAERAG
jgi:hypothetical protein